MKLNGHALGISMGITWGASLLIATILLIIKAKLGVHYEPSVGIGPTLGKIGQFYMGYSVTFLGSIIGFIYGFVHAYITARIIVGIYNKLVKE